jgi:malate dehydrogenase
MTVIGAENVEAAAGPLIVSAGDIVTPLARERANALGIEIVVQSNRTAPSGPGAGSPSAALSTVSSATTRPHQSRAPSSSTSSAQGASHGAPPRSRPEALSGALSAADLASAPRTVSSETLNGLYRRGAPVPVSLATTEDTANVPRRTTRPRVAVIGAGHVGSIATLRLAESDLFAEIVLIDVVDGLAAGVALDLWHSSGLGTFDTAITGSTSLSDLDAVDYVVVTAGKARKPGMTRTDLTQANAEILGPIALAIAENAPDSVIVVVTNPLEEMTHLVQMRSGFPSSRVLGMAGVLDTSRFASLVALTGVCRPEEVEAYALGSHGPEMVIPLSQARGCGRPLTELLDDATLTAITERARDSGAEVVSLLKTGSAYFAPGQSAARMVNAMASNSSEIMACAVVPDGQYGLRATRVGLPVRLGPAGLSEIVTLDLDAGEQSSLRAAADSLAERIREVS